MQATPAGKKPSDPILQAFRAAVARHFGDRLERIVLYGSRAQGVARPDSDYDIVIFIHGLRDRFNEFKPIASIANELLDQHDVQIDAQNYPAGAWRDESSTLMHQVRAHGL